MQAPPFLKKGDKVAVLCTASKVDIDKIMLGVAKLKKWGLDVVVGDTVHAQDNQYAGTDEERALELQNKLDDPNIKAIICGRGGYGTVRIIDKISFENFVQNPKWICGFSDVTVLHNHINQNFNIQTLHSVMVGALSNTEKKTAKSLKRALFGKKMNYKCDPHSINKNGEVSGELIGGNLSLIYSLMGSNSQINTDGKILFLEDIGEKLYSIDRMMMCLKRGGLLTNLKGLIVGGFTGMKDNDTPYGKTAEEIVLEHTQGFGYPIAGGFPSGHMDLNLALAMGREVELNITEKRTKLSFI